MAVVRCFPCWIDATAGETSIESAAALSAEDVRKELKAALSAQDAEDIKIDGPTKIKTSDGEEWTVTCKHEWDQPADHVYGGVRRGSLRGVYVQLTHADGSTTGRGVFELVEGLCSLPGGVGTLAAYLAHGAWRHNYVLAEACARWTATQVSYATVCDAADGCARVAAHLVRHGRY